jgi:hypothetical protein|tara:strand:- start:376 stop:921 length:546 start_codon:yes stop_codon:yes gene_type:complete
MQEENTKDLTEDVATTKHWQWIKGDLSGDVVTFKDEGPQWITFNEGGRIATDLRDEFLQQLDPDIAGEFIKPNATGMDPLNISAPVTTGVISDSVTPIKQTSPIRVLFNKQKKNSKVKLLLEFPVNIPPKGMYELMSTSFDKDEVDEQLQSFILDQLSEDEILDCLHNSVQSLIESKYKGE